MELGCFQSFRIIFNCCCLGWGSNNQQAQVWQTCSLSFDNNPLVLHRLSIKIKNMITSYEVHCLIQKFQTYFFSLGSLFWLMKFYSEVITSAEFHPVHCNLLAYSSSRGFIRLVDMRQSALCDNSARMWVWITVSVNCCGLYIFTIDHAQDVLILVFWSC